MTAIFNPALRRLLVLDMVLLTGLAGVWLLGELHWVSPSEQQPDSALFEKILPVQIPRAPEVFPEQAARPLFSPTRRQEPPANTEPVPVKDELSEAVLLGVFRVGKQGGGVILRLPDAQVRRLRTGAHLGGWVLRSVQPRKATFERKGRTRVLELKHSPQQPGLPEGGGASARQGVPSSSLPIGNVAPVQQ